MQQVNVPLQVGKLVREIDLYCRENTKMINDQEDPTYFGDMTVSLARDGFVIAHMAAVEVYRRELNRLCENVGRDSRLLAQIFLARGMLDAYEIKIREELVPEMFLHDAEEASGRTNMDGTVYNGETVPGVPMVMFNVSTWEQFFNMFDNAGEMDVDPDLRELLTTVTLTPPRPDESVSVIHMRYTIGTGAFTWTQIDMETGRKTERAIFCATGKDEIDQRVWPQFVNQTRKKTPRTCVAWDMVLRTRTARVVDWHDESSGRTWQLVDVGDWAGVGVDAGAGAGAGANRDEKEEPVRKRIAPSA